MADTPVPVVCTLTTKAAAERSVEWQDLRAISHRVDPIEGGARFILDAAHEAAVSDLAQRERACCAFLSLDVRRDASVVTLDVTAPSPEGQEVVALIAGFGTDPE